MTRIASRRFGAAHLGLILCLILVELVSPTSAQATLRVKNGQTIQSAIHAANPGDRIVVEAGTYAEQLNVVKDGISLISEGAILVPPTNLTENGCSGLAGPNSEAGICVFGTDVQLAPYVTEHRKVLSVGKPVEGVSITGFQIRGFGGLNIAVIGAKDAEVFGNWLYDGGWYGFLTAGSINTHCSNNAVISSSTATHFIAICNDDVSGAQILYNTISGYDIGLCIQTPGAEVAHNDVSGCCFGAFIDPGVKGATVRYNRVTATGPNCATDFPFGASGVIIDGSIDSFVQYNVIDGQTEGGMSAGIAIIDEPSTTPVSVASGNIISGNVLTNNDLDIFVNTTGSGNVIEQNQCTTPPDLCG